MRSFKYFVENRGCKATVVLTRTGAARFTDLPLCTYFEAGAAAVRPVSVSEAGIPCDNPIKMS